MFGTTRTQSRCTSMICRLLLVWVVVCCVGSTGFAEEQVRVLTPDPTDADTVAAVVSITVPSSQVKSTTLLLFQGNNTFRQEMPQADATALSGPLCSISREVNAQTQTEKFYCYINSGKSISLAVVRIGNRRFPVEIKEEIETGQVAQKLRNTYGPLEGRYAASQREWTIAQQRRALEASVRITGIDSLGSGTIVETPPQFRSFLRPGEVLVATAAHVVPPHFEGITIRVEDFTWDAQLRPKARYWYSARLVFSQQFQSENDVAFLAFSPGAATVTKVPIADANRWYSDTYRYFTVGCPGGNDPRFSFPLAVSAGKRNGFGNVCVSTPSQKGESGGGLFDPDGYLVGIRSASSDSTTSLLTGVGLIDAPEEGRDERSVATSFYTHPFTSAESIREKALKSSRSNFHLAIQLLSKEEQEKLKTVFEASLAKSEVFAK